VEVLRGRRGEKLGVTGLLFAKSLLMFEHTQLLDDAVVVGKTAEMPEEVDREALVDFGRNARSRWHEFCCDQ